MLADSLQIQVALAQLAALDGRPDALLRGDLAAKRLAAEGLLGVVDHTVYLSTPPAGRLAVWAQGGPVPGLVYTPSVLGTVREVYDSYYGGFLPFGPAYKTYSGLVAAGEGVASGAKALGDAALGALKGLLVVGAIGLGVFWVAARSDA